MALLRATHRLSNIFKISSFIASFIIDSELNNVS